VIAREIVATIDIVQQAPIAVIVAVVVHIQIFPQAGNGVDPREEA
jgi:hypothetical protein